MTLRNWLDQGNDVSSLMYHQVRIKKGGLRNANEWRTARFEGLSEGKAILRQNGSQENSWYGTFTKVPEDVEVVFDANGHLVPYDARPLTQR